MKTPRASGHIHLIVVLILVALVILGIGAAIAQRQPAAPTSAAEQAATLLRGVAISPRSYTASGLQEFFRTAAQLHGVVTWQGDWQELGTANSGATTIATNAATYGYTPLIVVTAFTDAGQSRLVPILPLTSAQLDAYVAKARAYAQTYRPKYFGVGIEVNRIYETSPSDYQTFVALFNRTAAAVHAASPHTQVLTTFQLERLQGLRGGLYGGVNDANANNWSLLSDFSAADDLGFTTYPSLLYTTPTAIPANYYAAISQHTTKPVLFTEAGWPAADQAAGWSSDAAAQQAYVQMLLAAAQRLSARVVVWSFLFDQSTAAPFASMGLFDTNGTARPAWQTMLSAQP